MTAGILTFDGVDYPDGKASDPRTMGWMQMVVARFASHPIATSAANDPITLPAFLALARMLNAG